MSTVNRNFEQLIDEAFVSLDRFSLSAINNRLRLELGGEDMDNDNRVRQAIDRSASVLKYCFEGKEVLLRIVLWDRESLKTIENLFAGLKYEIEKNDSFEDDVIYVKMEQYDEVICENIAKLIIHHDMALEPSVNITCYFMNFDIPAVVNIYDDRGLGIVSPDFCFLDDLSRACLEYTI